MKIKLVTFVPHPNFGTCLQSYALNAVLKSMGHDVEFIYTDKYTFKYIIKLLIFKIKHLLGINASNGNNGESFEILSLPDSSIKSFLAKYFGLNKLELFRKRRHSLQWAKVVKFAYEDDNYKMRHLYSKSDIEAVVNDADLFITGSDQIWNPYCAGFDPFMFLEFVKGRKKCISYSSSISLPQIPASVSFRIKNDLSFFQHIAVREQKSVELLNNLLDRSDVKLVIDPTYLLSSEEWISFANRAHIEFPLPDKYIFCYCIGSQRKNLYKKAIEEVKEQTGINEIINLECYNRDNSNWGNGRLYKDAGPYEWVYLLLHSSYVVMDSFHATVFALKFKKDFVHILKNIDEDTGSQNARMYDILNRYGLLDKIYHDDGKKDWLRPIDYSKVTPILEAEIKESFDFLRYEIEE